MRVLLDENLPHDLIAALSKHQVATVQGAGWAGVENGELLRRASGQTDAFITMDRRLQREQNLSVLPFGVVLVPEVLAALERVQAGRLEQVGD